MKAILEKIISALDEDDLNKKYLTEQIAKLSSHPGHDKFYANLLERYIHLSMEEEEAKAHWWKILDNYQDLKNKLNRDVGIRVAMADYFVNLHKKFTSPILVEIHVFKEAEKMAMVDGLTGIFNRRYFDLSLKKELRRASRYDKDFALLMLDIDNFKNINDTLGHPFGDEVLKKLASLLLKISREEDIICRYGGEEFIIILPETTADGALNYAERIRTMIKDQSPFKEHKITLSGGISPYPYGGKSAAELLKNADKALYEAKFSGKNCVVVGIKDKRRRTRHKRSWKVCCRQMDSVVEDVRHETYTQDVSLGGINFELNQRYDPGTELLLEIELPNGDIKITGRVAWSKTEKNNSYRYGVKFSDLRAEQKQKMIQLLPSDYYDPAGEDSDKNQGEGLSP